MERGQWWPDSWFGRFWIIFGFAAQAAFTARFLIQWIASEYKRRSHVPKAFRYLSLAGSLISLTYFIHAKHPILILAFSGNTFIYARNVHLIRKHAKEGVITPIEYEED